MKKAVIILFGLLFTIPALAQVEVKVITERPLSKQIVVVKPALKTYINSICMGEGIVKVNINYMDADGNIVKNEEIVYQDTPAVTDEEGAVITPAGTGWKDLKAAADAFYKAVNAKVINDKKSEW